MKVGIMTNRGKPAARALEADLLEWLRQRGHQADAMALGPPPASSVRRAEGADLPAWVRDAAFILVLGGDGTLLKAARLVAPAGAPLLGINLGHLGFITELEVDRLYDHLQPVLDGTFSVETRSMLSCRVVPVTAPTAPAGEALEAARKDGIERLSEQGSVAPETAARRLTALNDVVVTKGSFARLIHLALFVNGTYVTSYPADGLIISTPTGSTAYALAAGGPIVHPHVDVVVVTPICAHTLYSRPLVVSASETVHVQVQANDQQVVVTADGQDGLEMEPNSHLVEVTRAEASVRFLRHPDWSFYGLLREKFHEGGRPSRGDHG